MKQNNLLALSAILTIMLIATSTSAFSFFNEKKQICTEEPVNTIIYQYQGTQVSPKILSFINDQRYDKILLKVKDKKCAYTYHITISDEGIVTIANNNDIEAKWLKVTTTKQNIINIENAYKNENIPDLIISAIKVKTSWKAKLKALIFLNTYL